MPKQVKKSLVLSIYFALLISTLLVFWQVRNFDFLNYDDDLYVYENPHIAGGLTFDNIKWALTTGEATNWHPLTWLSLMLDCQLFGADAAGRMHLVNLLFHLANILLLFKILKKMTDSLWQSAFVAALFALHPMHVESVAWIAERKDVLSTFFLLLTIWAYFRYVKQPNAVHYLLTMLMFVLGLMAKPMLVTLPFVLLLLDYWPLERKISRHLLMEKIPFFAISIVSSVITFLVQRSGGAVISIDVFPLSNRIANTFLSYARYIGKMFWPQNMTVFYPFDAMYIPFWQIAASCLLLLVISIFVIRLGRNQKYLPLGWFWFVGTLVPVIGIIQVGLQAYADRYTYVSYIGLFIMLAWGVPQLLSKWIYRKIVLGVSMALVLTVLGICAHRQTSYWKNSITFFSHALEVTQNNYVAYNNLGLVYDDLGRSAEAMENFSRAIKIMPNYAQAHTNLGIIYTKLGRWQDAIDEYQQAIKYKPDFAAAYNNLGLAYDDLGRSAEAIEDFKRAIRIKPDYAESHTNLGIVYTKLGRWPDAIDEHQQAIKFKPDFAEAYNNLGIAYAKLGRWTNAINAYQQAVKFKPDFVEAYNNLGYAYATLGRYPEAIDAYQQGIKIKPDLVEVQYNLGNACYALGRYPEAINVFEQVIKIKPDYAEAHYNLGMTYSALGRWPQAIDAFKQAVKFKPDLAIAHKNLGVAYLVTGDKNSALAEYNILKSLNPQLADELLNQINK
jgi:protein O-mannosyl-transferase